MKSERRPAAKQSQQQQGKAAVVLPPPDGVAGLWVRYGNTALTVLLLVLAAYLFVRWRTRSAEVARHGLAEQLAAATGAVRQVRPSLLFPPGKSPAEGMATLTRARMAADARLTDLVNAAADDARTRAAALMLRGDLNWTLANLPALPGAATDPAVRLPDPPDVLLKRSADAYADALAAADDDPTVTGPARLGMAAVAEDRGDWPEARKQLDAVVADGKALTVLADRAKAERDGLPALQRPLYLGVPPAATTAPTTAPTTGPTTGPTTNPTTSPATTVTTLPVQTPATLITPTTRPTPGPTTGPATHP